VGFSGAFGVKSQDAEQKIKLTYRPSSVSYVNGAKGCHHENEKKEGEQGATNVRGVRGTAENHLAHAFMYRKKGATASDGLEQGLLIEKEKK